MFSHVRYWGKTLLMAEFRQVSFVNLIIMYKLNSHIIISLTQFEVTWKEISEEELSYKTKGQKSLLSKNHRRCEITEK